MEEQKICTTVKNWGCKSSNAAPSIPTQSSARAVAPRRICAGSAEARSDIFSAEVFIQCVYTPGVLSRLNTSVLCRIP